MAYAAIAGKLVAEYTAGGHRRYDLAKLRSKLFWASEAASRKTVAHTRVSSHDQSLRPNVPDFSQRSSPAARHKLAPVRQRNELIE